MALIDSLTAYYKLENTSDSHGSYTLTNTGSVPFNAAKIDNGADFTPNDSLNNNSVLSALSYPRSFSCWAKFDSVSSDRAIIALGDGSIHYYALKIDGTSGTIVFRSNNNTEAANVDTGVTPSTATWYHLVVVQHSNVSVSLYVNNTKTNTTATTFIATVSQFFLGYLGRSAVWYLDGIVDECGIWNKALSDAEVAELYNSGNALAYPFSTSSPSSSPSSSASSSPSSSVSSSPSSSVSDSPSSSPSTSVSSSPSSSVSDSPSSSPSSSPSPSSSVSSSPSSSPSGSTSPSSSPSTSVSDSPSSSPSSSMSSSPSSSVSSSPSVSVSDSVSDSPSTSVSSSPSASVSSSPSSSPSAAASDENTYYRMLRYNGDTSTWEYIS